MLCLFCKYYLPFGPSSATLSKLLTHVPLLPSSIIWFGTSQWAVMSCGWGSNRRSGVALAVPHRHYRFSTYGLKASEREMSTRLHSLSGLWYTLPLWHYGLFLLKAPVKCQSDQSMPNSGTRPSLELSMVNTTVKMEVAIVLLTAMHRQSVQNILVRRRR